MPRLTFGRLRLGSSALLAVLVLISLPAPARAGEFESGLALFRKAAKTRETDPEGARDLFRQAAGEWEALAARGRYSAHLETDIGNARAFAGDLGEAVVAYRRALLLDPGNDRARNALDSIRGSLGIEDSAKSAESGLVHALFFWHWALSFGTRRTLFAIAWVAGFLLIGFSLVRKRRRLRIPGIVLVAVGTVFLVSLLITDSASPGADQAVLVVRTQGRTGDGAFYSPSHSEPLPAGAELTVMERRGGPEGWVHARLRDGTTTWLPAKDTTPVIP